MTMKAMLFDAGNVLYHRPRQRVRLSAFLTEQGLSLLPSNHPKNLELRRRVHMGAISEAAYHDALLDLFRVGDPVARRKGRQILYEEERDIEYFEGVPETLRHLKTRGLRLSVVTNTEISTEEKMSWFREAGIDWVWDSFATSSELEVMKPDPRIYLVALEPLRLSPEEAAFVGHAAVELSGAKCLGMTTIAFNRDDETVSADYVIDRFPDLLRIVEDASHSPAP